MKARVLTSESEVKKLAEKEYLRLKDTVYENVINDVIPQFMGVCLTVLNRENNFGKIRLQRFLSSVISEFKMMNKGILFYEYTPFNCLDFMKDKYGIDIDCEFKLIQKGEK